MQQLFNAHLKQSSYVIHVLFRTFGIIAAGDNQPCQNVID
jgi:hypothetical protein